jgi:O-antigen ligase
MNHHIPIAGQLLTVLLLIALAMFGLNYHIAKPLVHLTGIIALTLWTKLIWDAIKEQSFGMIKSHLNTPQGHMGILLSIAMIVVIGTTIGSEETMAKRFSHDFVLPALCFALITPFIVISQHLKNILAWTFPVAILTMSVPGIDEYYTRNQNGFRVSGTIDLSIIYGMNLAILCATSIGLTLTAKIKYRPILIVFSLIAVACGLWAIALSGSRAPLLSILLITIFCIAYQGYRHIGMVKTLTILLIIFAGIAFTLPKLPIYKRLTYAVKTVEENNRGSSLGMRFEIWRGAKDIILERPLTGSGVGKHNELFSEKLKNDNDYLPGGARSFIHLHNDTINAITWMGIPLGLLFLLFSWQPLIYGIRHLNKPVGLALVAASSIYLINGLTNTPSIRATSLTLFLIVISLLMASCYQSTDKESAN